MHHGEWLNIHLLKRKIQSFMLVVPARVLRMCCRFSRWLPSRIMEVRTVTVRKWHHVVEAQKEMLCLFFLCVCVCIYIYRELCTVPVVEVAESIAKSIAKKKANI